MSEPQPKEADDKNPLDNAVGRMAVSAAKRLAVYACENLGLLVYSKEGEIILPEVHEYIRAHLTDPELITNDDIAEALEQAGEKYMNLDIIDELLAGIENRWLRGSVNTGIAVTKRVLHRYPAFIREFQEKRGALILKFLSDDPSTIETYRLLKDRPNLTRFITEAFMTRLGIPITAASPRVGVQ